jgi:hypothetical protein
VTPLEELAEAARELLAPHAVAIPAEPRFDPAAARAFVLEAVWEGWLMHYGEPRLAPGADPDLRLLAGDALYALGLARLAEAGDTGAVAELADLISLCAGARAEGRHEVCDAAWAATEALLLRGEGEGARAAAGPLLAPA